MRILLKIFLLTLSYAPLVAAEKIAIGYVPNLAFSQLFVVLGDGWDKEAGVELNPIRFSDASMSIQAFGKGEVDVLYTIITSGLVGRSKGLDLQVVAVATKNSNEFWGSPRLAQLAHSMPVADAIKALAKEKGGPVKILNFYRGSISDTVLRLWLSRQPGLSERDYSISNIAGQFQFTQAMLAADFDAISFYEPLISIARDKGLKLEPLLKPQEMLDNHPTAVLAVRGQWAAKHPELVKKLVEFHCRATAQLRENPDACVPHLQKFVSGGMLTDALVKTATHRVIDTFVTDPAPFFSTADILQRFLIEQKLMERPVDLKEFINPAYFEKIRPALPNVY
jgi:NitT/TauT family transport system substrate-binding protein